MLLTVTSSLNGILPVVPRAREGHSNHSDQKSNSGNKHFNATDHHIQYQPPAGWQFRAVESGVGEKCATTNSLNSSMALKFQGARITLYGTTPNVTQQSLQHSITCELDGKALHAQVNGSEVLFDSGATNDASHSLAVSFTKNNVQFCVRSIMVTSDVNDMDMKKNMDMKAMPTPVNAPPPPTAIPPAQSDTKSTTDSHDDPFKLALEITLPLLVIAFLVVIIFFFLRHRKRRLRDLGVLQPAREGNVGLNASLDLLEYETVTRPKEVSVMPWAQFQYPRLSRVHDTQEKMGPSVSHGMVARPLSSRTSRSSAAGNRRFFASWSQPSVSTIPQPPNSVEPPSTANSSLILQATNAAIERLQSIRRNRRRPKPVLRAINV